MQSFTAHRLHFVTQVQTTIELNEHQGSALRGALFHALRHKFCTFARDRRHQCVPARGHPCALVQTCPVAKLVSTLDPGHPRGRDRPRPYTIQPPDAAWHRAEPPSSAGHFVEREDGRCFFHYAPGETLAFGLTLYADAMALFPYVVLASQAFETGGLGRRTQQADGRWRRGTLTVREIWAENPLTGERQAVIRAGEQQVHVPDVPVTHAHIGGRDVPPPQADVTFELLTPTRIIEQGHLLKPETFRFRPFLHRLLDRLEALSEAFSATALDVDFPALLDAADAVRVGENRLRWQEVRSYSTRRHTDSPTSGLLGSFTARAPDWTPFWPWLLWGQFVHVGKDAVKGNGMYVMK